MNDIEKKEATEQLAMSERFTAKVLKEFGENVAGPSVVTDLHRSLIQGYFIAIDRALAVAEENRVRKNEKNTDPKFNNDLPVVWANVNLTDLAIDLMHYAKLGLDMQGDNILFAIPYKNNK
jgi:recombination protein RecT